MTDARPAVTLDSQLCTSPEVMMQQLADEAVLLDMASEQYFGLDPIGTRIWNLLSDPKPLRLVHEEICSDYPDVAPDRIEADLLALITDLRDAGLVRDA